MKKTATTKKTKAKPPVAGFPKLIIDGAEVKGIESISIGNLIPVTAPEDWLELIALELRYQRIKNDPYQAKEADRVLEKLDKLTGGNQ